MYLCLSKPISFLKNKSNNNNNNYNNNNETVLTKDEFEEAFKSLKRNKAPSHDGLDVNITSVYELIPQKNFFILPTWNSARSSNGLTQISYP